MSRSLTFAAPALAAAPDFLTLVAVNYIKKPRVHDYCFGPRALEIVKGPTHRDGNEYHQGVHVMESLWHLASVALRSSATLIAAVGLAIGVSTPALGNLVSNGGFETGDFTDWSLTGNSTLFDFVICPGVGFVPEGSCEAFFGPIGSDDTLSQAVTTGANVGNYVSFYFASDGGTPGHFSVTYGGVTLLDITDPPASDYTLYQYLVYFSDAGPRTLAFNFQDDSGYMRLDGVSVTVPEPATMALLGIGLVGLAFRRRRKLQ